MTLAGPVSLPALLIGGGAVAALYALHHLRARPQLRPVATLLFWKAGVRPRRPRAMWSPRFRHLWTFLLLSAIALLLAATWTTERWSGARRFAEAAVIDTGRSMATTDAGGRSRLSAVTAMAAADVAAAGRTPALVVAAGQPVLLNRADEPVALFAHRLGGLRPTPTAPGSTQAIELAAGVVGDDSAIHWYTDADTIPAGLPESVRRRVVLHRPAFDGNDLALAAATFRIDAASTGTLRVRLAGRSDGPVRVELGHGGATVTQTAAPFGRTADLLFHGVVADGSPVTVRVLRDQSSLSSVTVLLPRVVPPRFHFDGAVPPVLKAALLAVGTEAAAPGDGIAVRGPDAAGETKTPRIQVVPALAGSVTELRTAFDPSLTGGLDFESATAGGDSVFPAGSRPLLVHGARASAAIDDAARVLYLSGSLLTADADVPRRAAFPIFLQRVCAALVGASATPPAVAAERVATDPVWALRGAHGVSVVNDVPVPPARAASPAASITAARPEASWTSLALGAAFLLLVVESVLWTRRRIV